MRYCMRVLRSMTCLGNEAINQDLCDQGAINQLLGNDREILQCWKYYERLSLNLSVLMLNVVFYRNLNANGR